MIAAIVQSGLHIDHRIAREHTILHLFAHALLDGGDEFPRHDPAHDGVFELETRARLQRLKLEPHVAILAATA